MFGFIRINLCLLCLVPSALARGRVNVALNKRCGQSSFHKHSTNAAHAINNNTGGDYNDNNCIHTRAGDRNPSWYVDLGKVYPVWEIAIYGRIGYLHRMVDVSVKVDRRECARITSAPTEYRIALSCKETIYGQNITIEKQYSPRLSDEENVLNICEVQIWVCDPGYYGDRCDQPCGKCNDTVCGLKDGKCRFLPCLPGYSGDTCHKCVATMFGDNCASRCGKCKGDATCDQVTGNCPHGCAAGWTGARCEKECAAYIFGDTCSSACGKCFNNVTCHHISGDCSVGCAGGWTGSRCNKECATHTFGENCNRTCGNCKDNATCHHVTGECSLGCVEGWTGHQCDHAQDAWDRKIVIGASGGVLALIAVVVTYFVITKRRRAIKRRCAKHKSASGNVLSEDRKIKQLSNDNFAGVKDTSLKCQCPQTASSSDTTYPNVSHVAQVLQPDTPPEEGNVGKDQTGLNTTDENVIDMETDDVEDEEAKIVEETYAQVTKFHAATVALKSLHKYVIEKRRNEKLHEEFLNLPSGLIHDCDNGKENENRLKNRFNSILPYDSNRVILQDNGNDTSDYINASIIRDYKHSKGYIAAQGPKENTVDDFWRMVWQEEITQIIMLTALSENMKRKCYEYWPGTPERKMYGNVEVKCVDQQQRSHSVIRSFDIRLNNSSTSRRVEQYQYTSWMDHSAPCAPHLVDFWRHVKTRARARHNTASPPLVHCSAGVGRTGTYIALDLIMEQSRREDKVSFFKVVRSLRDDRCSMVQNKGQYAFLHEAVLEAYNSEKSVLDLPSFDLTFPDGITSTKSNKRIGKEFQIVQSMRALLEPPTHNIASALENRAKNRNPYALPADKYLVRLSLPSLNQDSYINAVCVPTMLSARGCVLTQLPLPDTADDLWRLVSNCEVATIVSLGEAYNLNEDLAPFWPMQKGQTVTTDYYSVSCISREQRGSSLDCYYLKLQHKQGESEVRLLHHKDWKSEIPASTEDVLHLVALLEDTLHDKGENPLLIQCIDGASRSGLFSALYDIILRMTYNHVVDVYSAVRNVHVVRPEAVTSLEEYRFLYEVAQQYRHSHQIYANT